MALFKVKSTRGGTPSKNNQHREDDNHAINNRTNNTAFASKCLIYLAALAYRALLTAVSCWCGWRNGCQCVLGALLVAIFGMIGGVAGASCW